MRNPAIIALAVSLLASPSLAGPVTDEAAKAEALNQEGNLVDALVQMDLAVAKLWDETPLTVLQATFVSEKPGGYGVYDPRPDSRFAPGEDMIVYVELAGYEYAKDGDFFKIAMTVDVEVKSKDGEAIGSQDGIVKLTLRSRVPNREFYGVLTYSFSGIPAGEYVATTTIHDDAGGDANAFDLDFQIE